MSLCGVRTSPLEQTRDVLAFNKWRRPGDSDSFLAARLPFSGLNGMNRQVEQALENLKSGRPEDVERALETLQETVYGFGMKVCGVREDAEDTAQETLIRLARQLKEFPDARALAVWLYKVAKTQCLMSRRKSKFAPAQMLSLDALMPKQSDAGIPAVNPGGLHPKKSR